MKKFLVLFIPILFLSFLFNINNANAQPFENFTIKIPFSYVSLVQENVDTYEYEVYYQVSNNIFSNIDINNYYFTTISYIPIRRLTNRNTNSYELIGVNSPPMAPYTIITIRVTLLKTFVNDYFSNDPSSDIYIANFFEYASALYASYVGGQGSVDYDRGYNDGFEIGRQTGYDEGYLDGRDDGYELGQDDGYNYGFELGRDVGYGEGLKAAQPEIYEKGRQDGYNEASKEFKENFGLKVDVWLVPAIIIVFAVGIFVTYRRGRDV